MNQVGALNTGANADLAASGINSLSGGSFGADFALLLGQISQDGSSGIGGALSSGAVRGGRTSFAAPASQGAQRRRDASKSSVKDLLGSGGAPSKAGQDAAPGDSRERIADDGSARGGDAGQGRGDGRSEGADAARADDRAQDAASQAAPEAPQARGSADAAPKAAPEDAAGADEQAGADPAGDGLLEAASDADPLLDDAAGSAALADARAQAQGQGSDAAQGSLKSQQPGRMQEAMEAPGDSKAAPAEAQPMEPEQARPVSENSAALGELFEDAGVTKVTVSQSQSAAQSQDAQQVADELSSIADSVKAADELFDGQGGQMAEGGEGQDAGDPAQEGVDGALAVLREGVKGGAGGSEDGGGQDGAAGALKALAGAVSAEAGEGAQDPRAASLQGAGAAGAAPLSESRLSAREALEGQDLRDAMLSLSSDVKRNAEKLTEAVMAMSSRNLKSFKFELNPEGLGSMQIKIDSTDDGDAVRIGISASSSQARAILAQGMDALREGLLRNGIFAQAELEGGDQGSTPQDGSAGQGAWQGREGGQGRDNGGAFSRGGTLFAGDGMDGADGGIPAPAQGAALEDGLSLFA